jgi:hypothetical protein
MVYSSTRTKEDVMKKYYSVLALICLIVFVGCSGLQAKKEVQPIPDDAIVIKLGPERSMKTVVDEMLASGGKMLKKHINAGHLRNGGEYIDEVWIIEDSDGNVHAVEVENGVLERIREPRPNEL